MHPFSYTSLKMIHDQKIQEALERHRLYAGQETLRQGLFQTFEKFLAHFTNRSGRKQEEPLHGSLAREGGIRFVVAAMLVQCRLPGVFAWPGNGRYEQAQRDQLAKEEHSTSKKTNIQM